MLVGAPKRVRLLRFVGWKEKQTQSAEWQYANCWTSVYAKLFDRLEPEEVLTVGGVCAEGVYTVEPSNANKCPIECGQALLES